jgi:hypothetical protein
MKQESFVVKRYGKTRFTQPTIEVTNAPCVIPFQAHPQWVILG